MDKGLNAGCLSGQKDLPVKQTRKLRGFESLTRNNASLTACQYLFSYSERLCLG